MKYTISAIAPNSLVLREMYDSLQIKCKSKDKISIIPRGAGSSLPMLSITTADLELAECYHDELAQAGALLVNSSEDSSSYEAVVYDDNSRDAPSRPNSVSADKNKQLANVQVNIQEVWVLQSGESWHVGHRKDGAVLVFSTRDDAIAYTMSLYFDGPSESRSETQRGDLANQLSSEIERKSVPVTKKGRASK
jgi:hypothetical protein